MTLLDRAASRRPKRAALAAVALALLVLCLPASALGARIYTAASLRQAFPRIDPRQTYNFAGSNQLQLQIERGAPADVFASASPQEAQALYRGQRCSKPVTFAKNTLVLLVPNGNPGRVSSVYSLRSGGRRLAIGNAGVPIGGYTRRLLQRMRLTGILRSNTVSQESNVASIVSKVALGSADAGFVYVTDARIAADRTNPLRLPRWAQPPVRYQICAVRRPGADAAGARSFINQVLSPRGRAILRGGGFGLPRR